jgi:pimeloyl-ACP methyl ester carboxylesterase
MSLGVRTFQVETDDGARLHAYAAGEGPPVLLVSGLGGTAAFWNRVVACLRGRFTLISFDQRGIGASTRGSASLSIGRLAADCASILAALGICDALVAGHSTGGCIAQTLALQARDRVGGVLLSATWVGPNRYMTELFEARLELLGISPRLQAVFAAFLSLPADAIDADWSSFEGSIAGAPATDEAREIVAERIRALLAFDGWDAVAEITIPASVIGTRNDQIVPFHLQLELARLLPHARMIELERGGHFFPLVEPQTFADAVEELASRAFIQGRLEQTHEDPERKGRRKCA